MPASWQVAAVSDLNTAYELQSTTSGRLTMFSELFSERQPYWYWQVALNYQHVRYVSQYYIELSKDNNTIIMFSTE